MAKIVNLTEKRASEKYWLMAQVAFNCFVAASVAGDLKRIIAAGELHKLYSHKWKQAISRERKEKT